ncbi:DUF6573 family protein [Geobacter sp.]|uniref:DUF6573 family protein n=1 Tax=Geobacter sp. TaxID=46610 RepID=UPI0027B9F296|nr:DUF6573 family protein [Geobacter sp.]
MFENADVISIYTRADAIADGTLVDLSGNFPDLCGIYRYPVACTAAVWALVEMAVSNKRHGNDYQGVVWDILYMSQRGVIRRPDPAICIFQVIITGTGRRRLHTFKVVCGPGDDGEPVVTIMFPHED